MQTLPATRYSWTVQCLGPSPYWGAPTDLHKIGGAAAPVGGVPHAVGERLGARLLVGGPAQLTD